MAVQQLVRGAQATAAGAIPAGNRVEETAGVKTVQRWVEPEQNCDRGQCNRSATAPEKDGAATPHVTHDRRHRARRQWNADFTSGLHSTIKTQMPIGNPTQQHGEMHGTMEMIVAVMTIP